MNDILSLSTSNILFSRSKIMNVVVRRQGLEFVLSQHERR
jgi:hypothetical protein